MGDGLPEKLYMAWRSALTDPSSVPSWGNVPSEERLAWERVAAVARGELREQIANELGAAAVDAYGTDEAPMLAFAAQRLRGLA